MIGLTGFQWLALALLVVLYILSCVRVAARMKRIGRNGAAWFFISFFCTAIPATIVFYREFSKLQATGAKRCLHCGQIITPAEFDKSAPVKTCPKCGLDSDEVHLA